MIKIKNDSLNDRYNLGSKDTLLKVHETLLSWIVVGKEYTYKIKKPIKYTFVDYSTLDRRKVYCLQEFYLNRRLAADMYVGVVPVTKSADKIRFDGHGTLIDYAVKMKTMDDNRLMSTLLDKNEVTSDQITRLGKGIAQFHKGTRVIYSHAKFSLLDKFNDLSTCIDYVSDYVSADVCQLAREDIDRFAKFSLQYEHRLKERAKRGFIRDCHGDLHSGNIYLLDEPVPFDCIEFDNELREIDVLNEVAFLCMDLECHNNAELSQLFFETYNSIFPVVLTSEDEILFMLYKAYRANVRAKVNILNAKSTTDDEIRQQMIETAVRFLRAMRTYLNFVDGIGPDIEKGIFTSPSELTSNENLHFSRSVTLPGVL
jgi:aminoglycoside phosphotransferase family enzyme